MEINGDILETDVQYIAHQCNCVTKNSLGLAKAIFNKYPESNIYNKNIKRIPGEIIVKGKVINMLSQYKPGSPSVGDSSDDRIRWFKLCLKEIKNIDDIKSVAFPYKIGCGLAKGDWKTYKKIIEEFVEENKDISVYICRNN